MFERNISLYYEIAGSLNNSIWTNSRIRFHSRDDVFLSSGQAVFGLLSGPTYDSHPFYHDLGHILDFIDRNQIHRIHQPGFGFSYPEVEILNQVCIEPEGILGVKNEVRAISYQLRLMEMDGLVDALNRSELALSEASSLKYLADWINISHNVDGSAFPCVPDTSGPSTSKKQWGEFSSVMKKREELRLKYVSDSVLSLMATLPDRRILHLFNEFMQIITCTESKAL